MRTIQQCDNSVFMGALVQWAGDKLTLRTSDEVVGVAAGAPFEILLDGASEPILVVELCLHGVADVRLAVSMDKRGGRVYASGHEVTTTPNSFPIGFVVPADIGSTLTEYAAGELAPLVIIR